MAYRISATYQNQDYPTYRFIGYSKREAISRYREMYGLKGKQIILCVL